jgi:hypothetical protein
MLAVVAALLILNPAGPAGASRACEPLPARTWTFDREPVVASGSEGLQSWQTVRRTLSDDYRRLFGGEPGRLRGLGVKSDSDSTAGAARADFDDIQLLQGPSCERGGRGAKRE